MVQIKKDHIVVGVLLFIFLVTSVYSISHKSITNDELTHITSGYSYLSEFDFRMNPEHPPLIKQLAGFPLLFLQPHTPTDHASWQESKQWEYGAQFLYFQNSNTDQLIFWARIPMILIGLLLGIYVFLFAKQLYGRNAGYLATFFYAFSPNILAHTRLVTTDVGMAAFSFITVYYYWKYLNHKSQKNFWLTALFFGLALATKFTAVYLIAVLGIIGLVNFIIVAKEHKVKKVFYEDPRFYNAIITLIKMGVIAVGILILTYGIIHFDSFFKGLWNVIAHSSRGHNSFLLGEHSSQGWSHYFLIGFLIKTPIAFLITLLLSIVLYKKINPDWKLALKRDVYLIIPIAIFFGAFIFNKINIGLRHVLPMYPFLFVFASQLTDIDWKKNLKQGFFAVIIIWYVFASLTIAPNYLAYFNEAVGGPNNGHKFMIDSNIDWGQDLKQLGYYVQENNISLVKMAYFGKDSRIYRGINYQELKCAPEEGFIAASVNRLVGFDQKQADCLEWLRKFEPFHKIGHSIFLYDIKEADIVVQRDQYCEDLCKETCEEKLQVFEGSTFDESCKCQCSELQV